MSRTELVKTLAPSNEAFKFILGINTETLLDSRKRLDITQLGIYPTDLHNTLLLKMREIPMSKIVPFMIIVCALHHYIK